jgi:hypothetical protein
VAGHGRARTRTSALALLLALVACAAEEGPSPTHESAMLPARWTAPDGHSEEVPFSFEAQSANGGLLITTLGRGGEHFRGSYTLVQKSTQGHLVTEVYNGWSAPEWDVWKNDGDGHWTAEATSYGDFAHFYTGKVVAYMPGSKGHAMRCRFTLSEPSRGFLAGGSGECQTSDKSTVELRF